MGVSSVRAREYANRGLYLHATLALVKPNHESLHLYPSQLALSGAPNPRNIA